MKQEANKEVTITKCIDGCTDISFVSVELACTCMKMNYERTKEYLDALLTKHKGIVLISSNGDILINTIDERKLATDIVKKVIDYFGEPQNKPQNTNREKLIVAEAEEWLKGIQDNQPTPQQYVDFVNERFKSDYKPNRLSTEIKERFAQWMAEKREQPDTLNDEQAGHIQLPDELATEQALKYWERAKEQGLINADYSFIGTIYERAYFADEFSNKLGIKAKWKYFQILWNCKNMAQDHYELSNYYGLIKLDFEKKIEKVFGDL